MKEISAETWDKLKNPKQFAKDLSAHFSENQDDLLRLFFEAGNDAFSAKWFEFGKDLGEINNILVFGMERKNFLQLFSVNPEDVAEGVTGFVAGYFNDPDVKVDMDCVKNTGLLEDLLAEIKDIKSKDWEAAAKDILDVFTDLDSIIDSGCINSDNIDQIK